QDRFLARERQHRTTEVVVILTGAFNAAVIGNAVVRADLQLLQIAGLLLEVIDALDERFQQLGIAGPNQQQALVLALLPRRTGAVRQDNGIPEDVVAQPSQVELELLLESGLHRYQFLYFRSVEQFRAQGRAAKLLNKRRAEQGGAVAAQVLQ